MCLCMTDLDMEVGISDYLEHELSMDNIYSKIISSVLLQSLRERSPLHYLHYMAAKMRCLCIRYII